MPAWTARSHEPELIDGELDPDTHRRALDGLLRINAVSRTAAALWERIVPLTAAGPLRILDVGCGGGGVSVGLWKCARRTGAQVVIEGCDASASAVALAAEHAARQRAPVRFFTHRAETGRELPDGYDVVLSTLVLHHLDDDEAIALLDAMATASSRLILLDDLRRTARGWLLAWLGTRLLTSSSVVHHDGPLSVRRAFTVRELGELARRSRLGEVQITTRWPQRMLLAWSQP